MAEIERFHTHAPWEKKVGYCRAVRNGAFVAISGSAPVKDGQVVGAGNPYLQAQRCLEIIDEALRHFGLPRHSIVRTRMFVTDISLWAEFGRAHEEFFRDGPPATSMLEVVRLIDPAMLIEIEADAIYASTSNRAPE